MVSIDNNEHLAQIKNFDETKIGVKGLVDTGISAIPPIFFHKHNGPPQSKTPNTTISVPTIDLSGTDRNLTLKSVKEAIDKWGFFQVVNHGIPQSVLDGMLKGVKSFFEDDDEVKMRYFTRDCNEKVIYNPNFDLFGAPAICWRDSLSCLMAPSPPSFDDLPPTCREILVEYSNQVLKLGKTLFEMFSEILGLKPSYLNDIHCNEGIQVYGHYYPACPQPELTMGTPQHTDNDFMTVLLQDDIGGLQVERDGQWFQVPPTPGALVINIGDFLQLITNDKFKSVEHKVAANTKGPRISVATFFTTGYQPTTRVYGPIKELVSESDPPRYSEFSVRDYATIYKVNGTSALQHFKL